MSETPKQLSWRDPDGFVVKWGDRIFRAVSSHRSAEIKRLIGEKWLLALVSGGQVVGSSELTDFPTDFYRARDCLWLEHDPLPFPCYPHELTAPQLYESGLVFLDIAIEAAAHGWTLKDASAWNMLHSEGRSVFVDLLSFERLQPTGQWLAYGQFVRHFVIPLMLFRSIGLTPAELFLTNRDGVTPDRAHALLRGRSLLSAGMLEFVIFPRWLAGAGGRQMVSRTETKSSILGKDLATSLLLSTLRRLRRRLASLRPAKSQKHSIWSRYEDNRQHYSDDDLNAKKHFVAAHLGEGKTVLDLGCNAGEFSLLAAESGKSVVSADFDHDALTRLYERIQVSRASVTPFMLNIGRPTPAIGWDCAEVPSFLDRARGHFQCILALGLIHHLLVSERASMAMLAELFFRLGPRRVIAEWIEPSDLKFRQIAGPNAALYSNLNEEGFEKSMGEHFRLVSKKSLPSGTRVMYLWEA